MANKILVDFHHASLLQSLIMLFEDRLGFELYRPIGMSWYPDYWNVYPSIDTAKQYLSIDQAYKPIDGSFPLNQIMEGKDGIYLCKDIGEGKPNKAITLTAFQNTQFDILIASIPEHISVFQQLKHKYQPNAKIIYQIGNQWNINPNLVQNVLSSAKVDIPPGINGIIYHQEFPLDVFYYEPVRMTKKIYSFINCLGTADLFKKDWELFLELEHLMPDWDFKSFGGQCRNGAIQSGKDLADKMREATLIFHCKTGGDGMGHTIHNAAAVGRPLIIRRSDYQGKLAEPLLYEGSSFEIDGKTPQQIVHEIQTYNEKQLLLKGQHMYDNFKSSVDFHKEEIEIRKLLDNLL